MHKFAVLWQQKRCTFEPKREMNGANVELNKQFGINFRQNILQYIFWYSIFAENSEIDSLKTAQVCENQTDNQNPTLKLVRKFNKK